MWILWTSVAIILRIYVSLQAKPRFIRKNINCGSSSPSTTDCRNQLQKWILIAGSRGCKAWITIVLQGLSFSNCVALLALYYDTPVSWARRFVDFLGVCSSLALTSSNFSSVSTRRLCFGYCLLRVPLIKFIHQIVNYLCAVNSFIMKFTVKFSPILSHRCHTEMHVALKYTTSWWSTLLANCNKQLMELITAATTNIL
jgi:hypothetical protein